MPNLTDPDADEKYAPKIDTQPGSTDMSEFEKDFDGSQPPIMGNNLRGREDKAAKQGLNNARGGDVTGAKDLENKEQEMPPDRSGFSAADDMREKLGRGYTGKGSTKSKGLSKLYSSNSKFKKKIAIAGAAAGGSLIGGILIFLAMLPLKIDSIIQNLDNTFAATTTNAMETTTDRLFSGWVKDSLLPALNKNTCTRTIDPGCAPIASGTGPVGKLYASWKKDRLDKKLAQNYGIVIGRKSNGRFVMNVNGKSLDITALRNGDTSLFDLSGTKTVSSRAILDELNKGLEGESNWKQVYKRYFITKKIDGTLGTNTHCLVVCDTREKVKLKVADAKLGAKLWILQRVLGPFSQSYGVFATCVLAPDECTTSLSPSDGDNPERSKLQQKIDSQLENYLASHTLNDLDKLAAQAGDLNKLGMSGYLTKLIAQQIADTIGGDGAKVTAGEAVEKAVPVVGWVSLASNLLNFAQNGPKMIKYLSYASGATAAAELYTTYRTAADEMHSGNTDPAAYGSLVDALSASSDMGSSHSDMSSTPLYNYLMNGSGNTFTDSASIFGDSTMQSSSYNCNNGKPLTSGLVCPEEDFTNDGAIVNAMNSVEGNGTIKALVDGSSVVSTPLNAASSITGFLPGKIGGALGTICQHVWPCSAVLNIATNLGSSFFHWAYTELIPNPFQDMSGGRTFDMVAAGSDVTNNTACYETLGCAKQSPQTIADIRGQQEQEVKDSFDSQPLFARIFSTSTPYSLVSRLAMDMPTTFGGMSNASLAGIFTNPVSRLVSVFSSIFTVNHAFAAETAQSDPFGIVQYAYAPSQIPSDPSAYWKQNCQQYYNEQTQTLDTSAWYNTSNGYQEQDPNTGQEMATKPNPCMLILTTVQSAGGVFDASTLPAGGS